MKSPANLKREANFLLKDRKMLDWLENSEIDLGYRQIWITDDGVHVGRYPTLKTKWFPTLRQAIRDAMRRERK